MGPILPIPSVSCPGSVDSPAGSISSFFFSDRKINADPMSLPYRHWTVVVIPGCGATNAIRGPICKLGVLSTV